MDRRKDKIKIIIADSQFLITEGLKSFLQEKGFFIIEAIVTSEKELNAVLKNKKVNLLISGYQAGQDFGSGFITRIKKQYPGLSILIISNSLTKNDLIKIKEAGIQDIIYKTSGREEILNAIDYTLKEKKYYPEEIFDMLLESSESDAENDKFRKLTSSEIEIVKLVANGMTAKEIASKKNLSIHTINTHRKNIFKKLAVNNVSELIIVAIKAGWIDNIEYYI
jgi:DNA-binding NarL/FixJ family response regulator